MACAMTRGIWATEKLRTDKTERLSLTYLIDNKMRDKKEDASSGNE